MPYAVGDPARRLLEAADVRDAARALKARLLRKQRLADRGSRDNLAMRVALVIRCTLGSNCIDVGAHVGAVLTDIVRLAPNGRHFAFEPLPGLAQELRAHFPTVEVQEVALSDRQGVRDFVHVTSNPGFSGFRRRSYPRTEDTETIQVTTAPLDDVLPPDYIPAIIKVDVEGAEAEVFRGSMKTIVRSRPVVLFEHGKGAADHYGTHSSEIYELLCTQARLRLFDGEGNGPYSEDAFCDQFAEPMWNWIAAPIQL